MVFTDRTECLSLLATCTFVFFIAHRLKSLRKFNLDTYYWIISLYNFLTCLALNNRYMYKIAVLIHFLTKFFLKPPKKIQDYKNTVAIQSVPCLNASLTHSPTEQLAPPLFQTYWSTLYYHSPY